ncbi:MAG: YihY/virulence factor BrkB family protein, partial [Actinomycetes bacterium]
VLSDGDVDRIRTDVLRVARDVLTPSTVNSDVAPILNQILGKGQLEVVSIGFLISLWSGSTAINDYLNTITVAYGMRGLRGAVRSRVVALGLYLCAVVVGIVMLPLLALGPDVIVGIFPSSARQQLTTLIHVAYFPVVAVGSVAVLAAFYKACLPVSVRYRRSLPGAFVAMVLWVVLSFGVRSYLESSFRAKSAYGSLAAPIAVLLFFYVTALAVLLGAEFNSAIDAVWPVSSTADARARSRRLAADSAARLGRTAAVTGAAVSTAVRELSPDSGWRKLRDRGST